MKSIYISRFITSIIFMFVLSSLSAQVTDDEVLHQRESVIDDKPDYTTLFFQNEEKAGNPAKLQVITRQGKTTTLQALLKSFGNFGDHVLADMDGDNKKELVLYNYTGGAHCCDEIYIYRQITPFRYQYTGKLFAGSTQIREDRSMRFDLYESFGYFFTCYACSIPETEDEASLNLSGISVRYRNGKLHIVPGDKELRSAILDNLGKMSEMDYSPITDKTLQDDGQRKAFVLNLAVFYFSFGKNMVETQKLFNRFYKHPDARQIWQAFVRHLQTIRKNNSF